jgi:hypothetical protein
VVSTPEQRLKKRAEELRKHPPATPARHGVHEQQVNREAGPRFRSVGQAYLERTETLIGATNERIYHHLRYSTHGTAAGFTLEVGHYLLEARIEYGWEVTVRNHGTGMSNLRYSSDAALVGAMDELLEPLVAGALEALMSGEEPPTPDAQGRS